MNYVDASNNYHGRLGQGPLNRPQGRSEFPFAVKQLAINLTETTSTIYKVHQSPPKPLLCFNSQFLGNLKMRALRPRG